MSRMKLYKAKDSWIVTTEEHSLWFNRRSLSIYSKNEPVTDHILSSPAWDSSFVSNINGYIGKVQFVKDGLHWLIFIRSQELVCEINKKHEIYRITDILVQPFDNFEEESASKGNNNNNHNKYELKCIEELRIWYQETQCFYYSRTYDLTNTVQRSVNQDENIPLWKRADERFFWNRQMLSELLNLADKEHLDTQWIQPIIMGYLNQCHFTANEDTDVQLILISRRNRHRSGVRMHCRGIDEDGNVANYVETEQIVRTNTNLMSFVMIRGSVPFYWSQPGIRYRPPPKIDRSKFK